MTDSMAGLLTEWASATRREWGEELGYPEKAAFLAMQGGSVPLPPAEVDRINAIGRAVWEAGQVERLVIHAHFRRRASYRRIADALGRLTGREVLMQEVGRLVANAIRKASIEYYGREEAA